MNIPNCPLIPLLDRVVVEFIKPETKIQLPDSYGEKEPYGLVLAVGPGRLSDAGTMIIPKCKPGDRVMIVGPICKHTFKEGDERRTLLIVNNMDILCVFKDEPLDAKGTIIGVN